MKLWEFSRELQKLIVQLDMKDLSLTARSMGTEAQSMIQAACDDTVNYICENPDLTVEEVQRIEEQVEKFGAEI